MCTCVCVCVCRASCRCATGKNTVAVEQVYLKADAKWTPDNINNFATAARPRKGAPLALSSCPSSGLACSVLRGLVSAAFVASSHHPVLTRIAPDARPWPDGEASPCRTAPAGRRAGGREPPPRGQVGATHSTLAGMADDNVYALEYICSDAARASADSGSEVPTMGAAMPGAEGGKDGDEDEDDDEDEGEWSQSGAWGDDGDSDGDGDGDGGEGESPLATAEVEAQEAEGKAKAVAKAKKTAKKKTLKKKEKEEAPKNKKSKKKKKGESEEEESEEDEDEEDSDEEPHGGGDSDSD